jgi:hypothetical protein
VLHLHIFARTGIGMMQGLDYVDLAVLAIGVVYVGCLIVSLLKEPK